jgi:hypothetical protein
MIHRAGQFYLRNRNSFEVTWGVTGFTVSAKISTVRIAVTLETTMTSHWKSPIQLPDCNLLQVSNAQGRILRGPRLMAQHTSRFLVWPGPRELRHAVVVELRRAFLGTVALGAVLAKLSAVLVVLLVAVETAVLVQLVLMVAMTRLASQGLVFALEYEGLVLETFSPRSVEM